jgi:hypothetical protein
MNTKKTAPEQGWGRYFVRGNSALRREDQPRLQLVVHWLRQLLALLCGLACGLVPLQGLVGLAGYAACAAGETNPFTGS